MKKRAKKLLSTALALTMGLSAVSLAGCNKGVDGFDKNKTHLFVGIYEGGFGLKWLRTMADQFEEMYADQSFEDNKTGVQIHILGRKTEFQNDNLQGSIATNDQDMYYSSINLKQFIAKDLLMDISDVVTTPLTEYGETRSIADKLNDGVKDIILGSSDGSKYYGIPGYCAFDNIVYDVDLFEEKSLYLAEDGSWTSGLVDQGAKVKSAGQDEKTGTYDDGLPVTWDDYKKMLNRMVQMSITPFIWNGAWSWYRTDMLTTLWANYEGSSDFGLNISFDGVDSTLGKIDYSNGYLLQQQEGKLKALEFAEYVMSNEKFYTESSFSSADHMAAQDEFLYSKEVASATNKRIAMLWEGNWWENEAIETINDMAKTNSDPSYKNRRFGLMTFPRMDENASHENVLYSVSYQSNVFIRKNAKQPELAKMFLRYTSTDENLRLYTKMTGSVRDMKYSLTEDDKKEMSYYKNAVWDRFSNENSTVVYDSNSTKISLTFPEFVRGNWAWGANYNGTPLSDPMLAFKNYRKSGLTAETYFKALQDTFDKDYWDASVYGRL